VLLRYFFIPVLLCLSCICFAQNDFKFESFTTENGLSENMVYAIYQDSKGYLWIGTHDGLNRYDGSLARSKTIIPMQIIRIGKGSFPFFPLPSSFTFSLRCSALVNIWKQKACLSSVLH